MDKRTIWNEAQNKPSLIVDDLVDFVAKSTNNYEDKFCEEESLYDEAYEILLRRGVFKWFTVRRKLIRLKNEWKTKIKNSLDHQVCLSFKVKRQKKYINLLSLQKSIYYEKGYRKALEDCRKEIRALCHSDRWQCPDNDSRAIEWFYERNKK